ncbi:hypothetical protein [Rhizobium sp. Rhizsp82]|uniref:hypothetical protein n=1 Tax=Rhizobium sp. Rhizsp82 TaxID=3243057 RepID=UPI0039B4CD7D
MVAYYRMPTFLERLLYYFLLPDLMAKIVYEILLRIPAISVTQPKQYMFYGFLALEYVVAVLQPGSFKPSWPHVNKVIILLVIMIFHGILVGLWWGNPLARMGIDTVNVLVVLANIVLLSDPYKVADTDFPRIFRYNRLYAIVMILLSIPAIMLNPASGVSVGGSTAGAVCMTILVTEIFVLKGPVHHMRVVIFTNLTLILATAPSWNRTALVFCAAALIIYLARIIGRHPFRVGYLALASVAIVCVAFVALPEDSGLYRRITGLQNIDLSDRTGSIGEREAESDAVTDKISALGKGAEIFGAGHGASYDVKYTWTWKFDYSNAHYGWVLFYLRYGFLGYLYMSAWIMFLVATVVKRFRSTDPACILVCLIALWNIGYLGTYGYFSFFIAGLPFMRPARRNRPRLRHRLAIDTPSQLGTQP